MTDPTTTTGAPWSPRGEGGWSRRSFLALAGTGAAGVVLGRPDPELAAAAPAEPVVGDAPPIGDWFPRQDPALVERVVGASHGDLPTVRELVERRPELARAAWDWGYGDWESALGAASHTGRREIALLLLAHGARPTIFSAAMLGQIDVVRAFAESSPGVLGTPGPHGIPLLAHARAGGEAAAAVVAYLEPLEGAGAEAAAAPLGETERGRYVGAYRFGAGARDVLEIAAARGGLTIARRHGVPRSLVHLGDHRFHPAGAPGVTVRFRMIGGEAAAVTIDDPEPAVHAVRLPVPVP